VAGVRRQPCSAGFLVRFDIFMTSQ
jgi:hypothetical protein